MNKNKLKSIMALHGHTNKRLSKELGVSPQRFSMKLNERDGAEFTQGEIARMKQLYCLTAVDVDEIFFDNKVS